MTMTPPSLIWNERACRQSCSTGQRTVRISSGALLPPRRLLERGNGFLGKRTNTVWETIERTIRRSDLAIWSNSFQNTISWKIQKSSSPVRQNEVGWHTREMDGEEICSSQVVKHLRETSRHKFMSKKTNPENHNLTPPEEDIVFPCADGSIKQEGHVAPRPHRITSVWRSGCGRRLRRSKTPSTSQQCGRRHDRRTLVSCHTSCWRTIEEKGRFLEISRDFIYRHHVAPRSQRYVPSEPSTTIPLKFSWHLSADGDNLEKLEESIIDDYWNVDGWVWDRFHLMWNSTETFTERSQVGKWKGNHNPHTSRPDSLWPEWYTKNGTRKPTQRDAARDLKTLEVNWNTRISSNAMDDITASHTMRRMRRERPRRKREEIDAFEQQNLLIGSRR